MHAALRLSLSRVQPFKSSRCGDGTESIRFEDVLEVKKKTEKKNRKKNCKPAGLKFARRTSSTFENFETGRETPTVSFPAKIPRDLSTSFAGESVLETSSPRRNMSIRYQNDDQNLEQRFRNLSTFFKGGSVLETSKPKEKNVSKGYGIRVKLKFFKSIEAKKIFRARCFLKMVRVSRVFETPVCEKMLQIFGTRKPRDSDTSLGSLSNETKRMFQWNSSFRALRSAKNSNSVFRKNACNTNRKEFDPITRYRRIQRLHRFDGPMFLIYFSILSRTRSLAVGLYDKPQPLVVEKFINIRWSFLRLALGSRALRTSGSKIDLIEFGQPVGPPLMTSPET